MTPLGHSDGNTQKANQASITESPYLQGDENSYNRPAAHNIEPSTAVSRKRKSDAVEDRQNISEVDDNDPRLYVVDETCNGIRRKIKDFIQGGNMKVGEFQKAIGVSSGAYQRFMNQSGTYKGKDCDTYPKAFAFFKKRELQGLKAAPPKRPRKSESEALDVSNIKLDGEDTQSVPVYDTCDEVRKKIRAFLRKPDISQSAFCRAIAESFPSGKRIQPRQLNCFLDKKGPMSGNTSSVFYGAYVFFEKLRMKEGRPKSEMRQEMEKIHPNGVNTTDLQLWWTCWKDERPVFDAYGRIHFVNPRSAYIPSSTI
ncbi:hypothetical protein F5Y00DRAFT_230576 [Daldinia vernicosa]|uniref:uncharacterized protein n=1 Tax=Daldinia vernicosa TaxID=114800 RepID=UPI002007E703|nr:uncharacterized protein F5Y00DRAFT_230576 [Daldinia vernicosa]KAI0851207.1 hypothetical protein F5Y00DRAFT_230576 [Daldinia vernicosa]